MSTFLQQLKLQNPNLRGALTNKASRVQRHDLAAARKSTLDKLLANKAYFSDKTLPAPDTTYKQLGPSYNFGIKYGNRFLRDVFNINGVKYSWIEGLSEADMPGMFNEAIDMVQRGDCDAAIKVAMQANLTMHSKKH